VQTVSRRALLIGVGVETIPIHRQRGAEAQTTAATPGPLDDLISRLQSRTMSDELFLAAVEALATVGVATFASPGDADPLRPVQSNPSPLKYLAWQVNAMAVELATRTGKRGRDLNQLMASDQNLTASQTIAGYASGVTTPGGLLVHAMLGKADLKSSDRIRMPALAQAMVAGDLLRQVTGSVTSNPVASAKPLRLLAEPRHPALFQTGTLCAQINTFVVNSLIGVADSLTALSPDTFADSQLAVDLFVGLSAIGAAARGGATRLTATDIQTIQSVATTIAIATHVMALIQPWSISVQPDPTRTRFGIDEETISGTILVEMHVGATAEWPADLVSCAADSGIDLPDLAHIASRSHWEFTESPIPLTHHRSYFGPGGEPAETSDRLCVYDTFQEPASMATHPSVEGTVDITVAIRRYDLDRLRDKLMDALLPDLPDVLARTLVPITSVKIATDLIPAIRSFVVSTGQGRIVVTYHDPDVQPETEDNATCQVGDWSVRSLSEIVQAMFDAAPTSIPVIYSDSGGSSTLHIDTANRFLWTFTQYTITGAATDPDVGTVRVDVVFDGSFEGAVHDDASTIIVESTGHTLTVTASTYLNDAFVAASPIETESWWSPDASITFACGPGEDELTMIPAQVDNPSGIVLSRSE
jgi:hypothetical protein